MKGRLTLRGREFVIVGQNGEEQVLPCQLLERTVTVSHRSDSLRLLAFSDYRVQNIDSLIRFLKSQQKPDLILYAGDDIRRFHENGTNFFQQLAEMSTYGLCAVAGNDDAPEIRELIIGSRVFSVRSCALALGNFVIVGVEGAPMFPMRDGFDKSYNKGYLLYPEPILEFHMKRWTTTAFNRKKLIIISHAPPFGILDLAMRFGRRNIGSRPLRRFLESTPNVLLCVSGHVHSQGAHSEQFGNTLVVNAASHDGRNDPGRVAVIQITRGVVSAPNWHEIR
jgi:Icc-related predicted phosphoesterase